jgi:hypothetical protein
VHQHQEKTGGRRGLRHHQLDGTPVPPEKPAPTPRSAPVHSSGNQEYETHIVGGDQSDLGEFPYYGEYSSTKQRGIVRPSSNVPDNPVPLCV